jgi:hypothetical protein
MAEEPKGDSAIVTDATLVAAVPAAAAAVAYSYELGQCAVFGVPSDLIALEWIQILVVAVPIIALAAAARWGARAGATKGRGPLITPAAALLSLPSFIEGKYKTALLYWITALTWDAVTLYNRRRRRSHPTDVSMSLNVSSPGWALIVELALWVVIAAPHGYWLGKAFARKQVEFHQVRGDPALVVLKIYGGRVIASPLDRAKQKLRNDVRILPLDAGVTLERHAIGPLSR